MRKLCLTLATAAAVLTTGALPSLAHGVIPGPGSTLRPVIEDVNLVEPARFGCTHFWNGRWHYREMCFRPHGHWGHHHHHHHHHRHFR